MNPFKYGQVVSGENFCKRPKLESLLKSKIASKQNIYIEGERRTGKTSLIFETVRHIKNCVLLHIDFFQVKSVNDIYSRILDGILRSKSSGNFSKSLMRAITHMRPTMSLDPLTGVPNISISASQNVMPDNITGLLDFINKEFCKNNTVVFFDEFQDITEIDDKNQILAVMRSQIQLHENLSYIYAGSIRKKMSTLFNNPDSPFYKSAIPINVDSIHRIDFSVYIINRLKKGRRAISADAIDNIFDYANDIPGDIQEFCHALWDVTEKNTNIDDNIIQKALSDIFSREKSHFESIINLLTDAQTRALKGVAKFNGKNLFSKDFFTKTGIKQPSSVKRSINRLESLKIIYNYNKQYKFSNPFFRIWLQINKNLLHDI